MQPMPLKPIPLKMSRITSLTLGVSDLTRSADFYAQVFSTAPNRSYEGIVFIELPGTWLSLFPLENLAEDISPEVKAVRVPFSGITLASNMRSKAEVLGVFEQVVAAGGTVVKAPADTFWGGFSGYFADPDGFFWEVAWGPMFNFDEHGHLTPVGPE